MKLCASTVNTINPVNSRPFAHTPSSPTSPNPTAKAAALSSEVKLSHSTHGLKTPVHCDIDETKVSLIKTAIASGEYPIDAVHIAQRMFDEISCLG